MATAKAGPRRTTRNVTLKLTEGEADLLLALTAVTGGHASKSPAKYARRVYFALSQALGYDFDGTDAFGLMKDDGFGISFDNYDETSPGAVVIMVTSDTFPGL